MSFCFPGPRSISNVERGGLWNFVEFVKILYDLEGDRCNDRKQDPSFFQWYTFRNSNRPNSTFRVSRKSNFATWKGYSQRKIGLILYSMFMQIYKEIFSAYEF